MSWGSNLKDAARRAYLGISRGTFVSTDDKTKMQEATVTDWFGQQATNVEHWQAHGLTMVPLPPDKDGQAEALIAYLGGSADHPVVISVADRRHRMKDLKAGDVALFDHRGQKTVLNKDGVTHTSPMTITHNTVDKDGKVMSSVVQKPDGKVTISNAKGAMIEMNGPNITTKPGSGGKHIMDGNVDVKGALAGLSVTSGGLPVKTV